MGDEWAYERDGRMWPRLTRILDIIRNPGLDEWRHRLGDVEADRVATKAAKIGTAVHKAIMAVLMGRKPPKLTGERLRAFEAWQRWHAAQVDFRPSRMEQTLFGYPPMEYAGTPDCIEDGIVSGRNRLSEWKCSGSVSETWWIQLHAQAGLAWPTAHGPYEGRAVGTHICRNLHGARDGGSCDVCRAVEPFPPITLRVVRIDPFLGLVEERERQFDPRVLATFLKLADVYRAWFFEPELQRRMDKHELIAAKSGGNDDEAVTAAKGDDDDDD